MLVGMFSRSITLSVRLRTPSIKFRYGGARDNKTSTAAAASPAAGSQKKSNEPIYDYQLPERFKRKPMSQDEIDYINRGGPD